LNLATHVRHYKKKKQTKGELLMKTAIAPSNVFGTAVLDAINFAYEEKGKEKLDPAIRGVEWTNDGRPNEKIQLRAANYGVEDVNFRNNDAWGEVTFFKRPKSVVTTILVDVPEDVKVFIARGSSVYEYVASKPTELVVNVEWESGKGGNPFPKTRRTDKDNLDVILLRPDGSFTQMQAAIETRSKKFWLSLQEVYSGQIIRTTSQKAKEAGLSYKKLLYGKVATVVPNKSEHAGPHGNYFSTMKPAQRFFEIAEKLGAYTQLHEVELVYWNPSFGELSKEQAEKGWESGTVSYFNYVTGFGHIMVKDDDGKLEEVFFRLPSIREEGEVNPLGHGRFPRFAKEQPVRLKVRMNQQGNPEATIVVPA